MNVADSEVVVSILSDPDLNQQRQLMMLDLILSIHVRYVIMPNNVSGAV